MKRSPEDVTRELCEAKDRALSDIDAAQAGLLSLANEAEQTAIDGVDPELGPIRRRLRLRRAQRGVKLLRSAGVELGKAGEYLEDSDPELLVQATLDRKAHSTEPAPALLPQPSVEQSPPLPRSSDQ